jgi:hypothetical protein
MPISDTQQNALLDALRLATNTLDKVDYIYTTDGGTTLTFGGTPATITWEAASSGRLTIGSPIDFEMPADRDVLGVAIWSSTAGTPSGVSSSVAVQLFTTIEMQTDEILRITALTYTIN